MRSRVLLALLTILAVVPVPVSTAGAHSMGAPQDRIVGGQDATEKYPFMASLQRADGGNHFCGGSVVAKRWVLTAAHCVAGNTKPTDLRVMVGSHELSKPGKTLRVTEIVIHPAYSGEGYDVALLRLATKAPGAPIKIAGSKQRSLWEPGDPARVIGWGTDFYIVGSVQDHLQEVDVPIVDDADCARSYPAFFGFEADTQVCAGEATGMKDSCQGDSGGPLMVGDPRGRWFQIGTVSWGLGCGFPLFYGVYGRVGDSTLRGWIQNNLS